MELDTFFEQTSNYKISLESSVTKREKRKISNEALFQIPFISMSILFLSKGRSKPTVNEICQKIGAAFERSFPAFRGSSQHLGWSSNMRVRTTTAVSFLEMAELITVNNHDKKISITDLGKVVIEKVINGDGNLKDNITVVSKNFNGIRKEDKVKGLLYEAH